MVNRMKQLREEKGLNMKDVAKALGMPYTTYVNYEKGTREPSSEILIQIANFFGTSIDYLVGNVESVGQRTIPAGFQPLPKMSNVPLVGRIACGQPITAEENVERLVSIPTEWHADFTLMCEGASMEPKIHDGDLVAIHCQPRVENGEIAAVRIGDEATLKRVFLFEDHVELRAENPAFASIIRIGEAMNDVHIEGKAVGLCRGL